MGVLKTRVNTFFNRLKGADIIKVFSFTAMSTLVKMLTGFISIKVVASVIGPAGIALLGQLNNFSTIALSLSNGGISSGITKYVAEYKDSESEVKILLSTGFRITIYCSLALGLLMMILHNFLSRIVMLSADYGYIFIVFGCTIALYALNMMLTSILNGYKEFRKYVQVNIVGSLIGLIFTVSLVLLWKLEGALIGAVTFQSIMLFVTFFMIKKLPWMSWEFFKQKINTDTAKKYFRYSAMALTTTATVPVSQIILRSYVISQMSYIEAGWWEAMNRLSGMYLMVITSSFGVYYLPRLSELKERAELRKEIFKAYKVIIPMLLSGFTLIYLFRFVLIRVLFTSDFLPMENLFVWQLAGDFFKISSWLLAFLMVAKAKTKMFISTEIIFAASFVGLSFLFMQWNGVVGITQAYMANYVMYLGMMAVLFKDVVFGKNKQFPLS